MSNFYKRHCVKYRSVNSKVLCPDTKEQQDKKRREYRLNLLSLLADGQHSVWFLDETSF